MNKLQNIHFKKLLIVFWTAWWLIALWTDIMGALAHWQWLHATWAPDSNYPNLEAALKIYGTPSIVTTTLFFGIIVWSAVASFAWIWASLSLQQPPQVWMARARAAFIISLSLWLAFFLADQIVMKFTLEENHMVQGGFELLTFLSLYLLPNND